MTPLLEEAEQCLADHALWTAADCKRLIARLAERLAELEAENAKG